MARRRWAGTLDEQARWLAGEVEAAEAEGLIDVGADAIRPTPRGMFFADAVASLLARRRLQDRRQEATRNDNSRGHM